MSPGGKVTEVVIMIFRENRGWEVKEKRFLNQFRGKMLRNSIRVDEDIINYTGATLSSKPWRAASSERCFCLTLFILGSSLQIDACKPFRAATSHIPSPNTRGFPGEFGLCTAKAGMPWEAFVRFSFGAVPPVKRTAPSRSDSARSIVLSKYSALIVTTANSPW